MDRMVRFVLATLVVFTQMIPFSPAAQTATQPVPPSTSKTTTPPKTTAKPAPAKPAPAVPAAKPVPQRPDAAARTVVLPNKPVARPVTSAPAPAVQAGRPGVTANPAAAQPIPARGTLPPGIVAGGKGAAIGSSMGASRASTVSNSPAAPAVRGRPVIPTGTVNPAAATQTNATAPAVSGRGVIPTPTSAKGAPTTSSSYIPSSSTSGRSAIPSYGSSNTSAAAAASGPATPGPNGSLGTFEYGQGMLTVYGCTRQGTQVLCDTDFNNQNQRLTQINTAWWRDVYLVDQYGDRHQRASAYFVNGAGEPREMLDIPYGQSARYIMVFNDFNANVNSVGFHSVYGNIDIENMSLDGSGGNAAQAGADESAQGSPQGNSAVANSVGGMKDSLKNNGKQRASDARDKAMNKANDSMQKLMDRIPH